jgi:hypothetical protein
MLAAVVAHQGGWDEILLVATPVLVFAVLLWVAKRRAEREHLEEQAAAGDGAAGAVGAGGDAEPRD